MEQDADQLALEGIMSAPARVRNVQAANNGRPKGAKGRLTVELQTMIKRRGINFLNRMWDRAERLEDEIDFKCAVFIGSRIWTKPRGAPVAIDLSQNVDARTLLAAVVDGQITPSDASSLWNSISRNGHGAAAAVEAGAGRGDIREQVAARLAKLIESRRAAPADDGQIQSSQSR